MNYFELFNIEPAFDLDLDLLASTYQKLQQLTHPDKFATASDRDRMLSVQKNAQVNDGFQILKAPLSRAEYLLNLRGLELQHEQKTLQDSEFLMQQMEWREQLEDISSANEPLADLDKLDKEIKQIIQNQLNLLEQQLSLSTELGNETSADIIRKLKFMYKLRKEIEHQEELLDEF